jgi:peptide deformylase
LSIPNLIFDVERFRTIYYKDDINGQKTYTGLIAQIIQHEHDHCEGKTLFQTGRLREDKLKFFVVSILTITEQGIGKFGA